MGILVELGPIPAESGMAARAGVWAVATVESSAPDALDALYDALAIALVDRGMSLPDVVRTRLWAATREARDAASKVRFRRLSGPSRCATSSYIDPGRFPSGDGVQVEALVLAGAGATKSSVEYEPVQPPCRYVVAGDDVILSGMTSTLPTFPEHLADLGPRLAESLRMAGERLGRPVRAVAITATVHRSIDPGTPADLAARLNLAGAPLTILRCDGFSSPGKLIEVEVNARAAAG